MARPQSEQLPPTLRDDPAPHGSARERIAALGGRVTRTRLVALELLQQSPHPLSHDEIGEALAAAGIAHDRVTLYRALDWLVERGLARRIAGGERAWRFEVMRDATHRHAHFHCDRCGQVVCLEGLEPAPTTGLPSGFHVDRAELVLHGSCAACGRSAAEAQAR
ncbi:Fur family transcriptional regulator [Thauera sinica]|uniref:Fur family transcriptional regulator n=1 Tax=Thauera sinica TaxID=2665146 RepID=A0ABW1AS96_9RHOO